MITVKCLASGSKGNSYAIDDGGTVLLLEAGIPANRITAGYGYLLERVAGCLVTHEHMDHARGTAGLTDKGIDIYASGKTISHLKNAVKRPYRLNTIKDGHQFELGTWIILPWQAQHDADEPLGFLIYSAFTKEKLLFATDTYFIPNTFRGLNYIMVECNYSLDLLNKSVAEGTFPGSHKARVMESHFSIDNVKGFLGHNDLSGVQRIYLIHVSGQNGDKTMFKREIMKLTGLPVTVF